MTQLASVGLTEGQQSNGTEAAEAFHGETSSN